MKETFTDIYRRNSWGDTESRSGPGSTVFRTRLLRPALAQRLRDLKIKFVLDGGCGDFNWMRVADLTEIHYTGVDVVNEIVQRNSDQYSDALRRFVCLDLTRDPLPPAELVLCRDCLVHFSFSDIDRALRAMGASGARYLLATTFEATETNCDIVTGGWRPVTISQFVSVASNVVARRYLAPLAPIARSARSISENEKCTDRKSTRLNSSHVP